jgi:hypothetical protein
MYRRQCPAVSLGLRRILPNLSLLLFTLLCGEIAARVLLSTPRLALFFLRGVELSLSLTAF